MRKQTTAETNHPDTLADDARALLHATADIAEETVVEARKRIAAALDEGRELYGAIREKAVEGAKVTDEAVRARPYEAIAVAFGLGTLLGCLMARRK